jgi:hypothetical protein
MKDTSMTTPFYIIRKAGFKDSYLTAMSTDQETQKLKASFGYVNDSIRFGTLTEAQAVAKVLCSKRSGLVLAAYEVLVGCVDDKVLDHTEGGAVVWSTDD